MADTAQAGAQRVFISYRRTDSAYPAGWLYDQLAERFGGSRVFKDVDSVGPGDDFVAAVADAVASADVLLAVIGRTWASCRDDEGHRRLENPDDMVRFEIETALKRGVRVIPVLVDGAKLPRAEEADGEHDGGHDRQEVENTVPRSLAPLLRRQAVELSPVRFNTDLAILLRAIASTPSTARPARPAGDGPAATPTPTPSPPRPERGPAEWPDPTGRPLGSPTPTPWPATPRTSGEHAGAPSGAPPGERRPAGWPTGPSVPGPSSGERQPGVWPVPPPRSRSRPAPRHTAGGRSPAALGVALGCAAVGAALLLIGAGETLLENGSNLWVGTTVQDIQHVLPPLMLVGAVAFLARPTVAAGWLVGAACAVLTLDFVSTTVWAAAWAGYEDGQVGMSSLAYRSAGAAFILVAAFVAPTAMARPRPAVGAPAAVALAAAAVATLVGAGALRFHLPPEMPSGLAMVAAAAPAALMFVAVWVVAGNLHSAAAAAPVVTAAGLTATLGTVLELWARIDLDVGETGDVTLALFGFAAFTAVGIWQWATTPSPDRAPT